MVSANDNNDTSSDNNACTADTCGNGAPMHPPLASGSACAQSGGTVCDGAGLCVECVTSATCSSGACVNNVCQTCTDGVKNGAETGIDCGGGACPSCAVGQPCLVATDCASGVCTANACLPASVVSTSPADGATAALESSPLAITFTGAMSPSSLTAQTTSGPCTGSIQASTDDFASCLAFATAAPAMSLGNTVATLVAAPGFSYGSTFKVRVTTAAADAAMSPLGTPYTSMTGFTTRLPASACTGAGFVVISQVYGGGGNVGAPLNKDFIELHNRGSAPVNITGWSVQYAAATSASWSKTALTGTIPAGGYFLVQEAGGAVGANLPTPDIATGAIAMAAGAGKIALVSDSTTLTVACPTGAPIVDLVGYGGTASCFEGTAPTAAPSATLAVLRGGAGCNDQNQNGADFNTGAPAPRNSASPAQVCTCGGDMTLNESGQPAEADYCAIQFPTAGITVQTGVTSPIVYGRIFEAGVTPSAGAAPGITAELGYGPATVNPEWQSGWQFFAASFNVQVGNDDEYQASFTAPAVGNSPLCVSLQPERPRLDVLRRRRRRLEREPVLRDDEPPGAHRDALIEDRRPAGRRLNGAPGVFVYEPRRGFPPSPAAPPPAPCRAPSPQPRWAWSRRAPGISWPSPPPSPRGAAARAGISSTAAACSRRRNSWSAGPSFTRESSTRRS